MFMSSADFDEQPRSTQQAPLRPASASSNANDSNNNSNADAKLVTTATDRRAKMEAQRARLKARQSTASAGGPMRKSDNPSFGGPPRQRAGPGAPLRPATTNLNQKTPIQIQRKPAASSHVSSNVDSVPSSTAASESVGAQKLREQNLTAVFDPTSKAAPAPRIDLSDMRNFLSSPVPKDALIRCRIHRIKVGLKGRMYPTYELYMESPDPQDPNQRESTKFLLAGKKRAKKKTANYKISMDQNDLSKAGAGYLGKLRANFMGTQFTMYDRGINPDDADEETLSLSLMTIRQELGAIIYEQNVFGAKGPRKMQILLPEVRADGSRQVFKPIKEEESILHKFKENDSPPNVMRCKNKDPVWNDDVGAYVLNFGGRVTEASVKNFQLVCENDPDQQVLLQFGRIGEHEFTCDFAHPLSPLQAFMICLSSFDDKLACE